MKPYVTYLYLRITCSESITTQDYPEDTDQHGKGVRREGAGSWEKRDFRMGHVTACGELRGHCGEKGKKCLEVSPSHHRTQGQELHDTRPSC